MPVVVARRPIVLPVRGKAAVVVAVVVALALVQVVPPVAAPQVQAQEHQLAVLVVLAAVPAVVVGQLLALSGVEAAVPSADASPSGPSVKSLSSRALRQLAACRFRVAMAKWFVSAKEPLWLT